MPVLASSRSIILNALRVTVAALAAMLVARQFSLPEYYWAPISAIVIMLSTIDPRTLAWQRFLGTALGAVIGALLASLPHSKWNPIWMAYAVGIFACGILSPLLRIGPAHRFAAITVTIVLLIAHERSPWLVALHRFTEVSIGIAVALIVTRFWPASA
jgi:uncharacterized membrane protein YgaE (UPF0421/DUF939 family)